MNMHIVVVGGCGVLGKKLIGSLLEKREHSITSIDPISDFNENIDFINADLTSYDQVDSIFKDIRDKYGKDTAVVHFAGLGDKKLCAEYPDKAFFTNVTLTEILMTVSNTYGFKKFIFPSSVLVYRSDQEYPVDEKGELSFDSIYSMVKIAAENMIETIAGFTGLNASVLRISNVYSEYSKENTLFGNILKQFLEGNKKIEVKKLDPGIDLIYIDDVVRAIEIIINSRLEHKYDVFNVSSGRSYAISEIVDKLGHITGETGLHVSAPVREEHPVHRSYSNEKIKKQLNWTENYNIDSGINAVIEKSGDKK